MTLAKRLLPAVSLILLFLFFASQSAPFRSMDNITNIVGQNAWLLIASMGMTIVILGGGIDLSVGSVMAFSGVVSVHLMVNMKVPVPLAMLAGLAAGGVAGASTQASKEVVATRGIAGASITANEGVVVA